MIQSGLIVESHAVHGGTTHPPVNPADSLEQRVRRLEDAVAAMQDMSPLEERLVERVAQRVQQQSSATGSGSSNLLFDPGRHLLPAAIGTVNNEGDASQAYGSSTSPSAGSPWLLVDLITELRTMVRMFLDRRYRATWTARVVPLTALILIVLSWLLVSGLVLVGPLLDRLVDVVLVIVAYKVLSREARRYREMVLHNP
jgi:hypothetical protein